jgi:hypothetical protein
MRWVSGIGSVCGVLTATALAAAEPLNEAGLPAERSMPAPLSVPPSPVPTAPQGREISRADAAYEAMLEAELAEPPLWYGWQTLTLDGLLLVGSFAALQVGTSSRSDVAEALAWVPVGAYAVGGPTIHLIHREPWRALGSLGLRAGLPVVGGAIGIGIFATCPPPDGEYGNCGLGELIIGVATGVLAASLIDGLALARESRKVPGKLALSLTPFISPDGTTSELRLRGQF